MSFLSGLAKVGQIIHTGASIATPFLGLIPGGNVVGTVLQVIFTAESVITQKGGGSLRGETVMAMLLAAFPNANPERLSRAVNLIVEALNLLANIMEPPVTAGTIAAGTILSGTFSSGTTAPVPLGESGAGTLGYGISNSLNRPK